MAINMWKAAQSHPQTPVSSRVNLGEVADQFEERELRALKLSP